MATVTQETIGLLHERLTVKLERTDYLPAFEKALKDYSRKANIPGFRKGHVPAGLIKKMYGNSVFTDEVLRSVDRELIKFIESDKMNIFAQPLPIEMDMHKLDMNNPADYTFQFEVGMKPEFQLADLGTARITRYKVDITDEMIDNEITRLRNRYGNMKDHESIASEEDIINVVFIQVDENGNEIENGIHKDNSLLVKYFREDIRKSLMGKKVGDFITTTLPSAFDEKEREWVTGDLGLTKDEPSSQTIKFRIQITKIGLLEKRELNEEFFNQLHPGKEIKTGDDFRNKIKEDIQAYWDNQVRSQVHDQAYHGLIDHSKIDFPELFLKKWIKSQGDNVKSDEEVTQEFPLFINQLKWTLITDKIVKENNIQVTPDDIRNFARQQLFGYMGMSAIGEDQGWVNDYIERMMKDRKYVEDAYNQIQTAKVFEWTETQVKPVDQSISADEFTKLVETHHHHHH